MKRLMMGPVLGTGLIAASTVLVTAPAAHAGSYLNGPAGQLTLWADDNYEGHSESRVSYDNDFGNDSCAGCDIGPGGNFEDDASSVVNRTDRFWVLAEDDNQGGAKICIRPYSHDSDLGGGQLEDKISSVERRGTTRPSICSTVIGSPN